MDLSADNQNLQNHPQFLKSSNRSVSPNTSQLADGRDVDIIDVGQINFGNDEFWLCTPQNRQEEQIPNLCEWLHIVSDLDDDFLSDTAQGNLPQVTSQKCVDTRTFTRPKKRFIRPSIEQYNEEMYGSGSEMNVSSLKTRISNHRPLSGSFVIQDKNKTPVEFDLSLPSSSFYFDKISAETGEADSFQNMSPPSLVNSMCSSTFANLMESSFIRNDPVLREIRDTDFTESILLQDSEPPMFQSITESCSSINSDTPENFLKKMSFNGTFRKNTTRDADRTVCLEETQISSFADTTIENSKELGVSDIQPDAPSDITKTDLPESNNKPSHNLNGTYRRTPKKSNTFRRSDRNNTITVLNSTLELPQQDNSVLNSTQTLIEQSSMNSFKTNKSFSNSLVRNNTMEDLKKQMSDDVKINTDLNRLSYCIVNDNLNYDTTFTKDQNDSNRSGNQKQSPLGCSSGSADSLDRMSSSMSSSSRGSNKMLNMADVDAIVEMQERSLQQVMSTPKPNAAPKKHWENSFISPIVTSDQISDSEVSSNDDYKSVRSTASKTSLDNFSSKNTTKSLDHLAGPIDTKIKTNRRTSNTITDQKPLQVIPSNARNTYSNLRTMQSNIPGSQPNLHKPGSIRMPSSNLKTMGPKLKGSYTSLRPISANLPVAPPINHNLNTTTILGKASNPNVTQVIETRPKVVEVLPMPRDKVTIVGDCTFIKPQQPKASGLPRPTGIPRPASRIPGPRGSNIRPIPSRSGNY